LISKEQLDEYQKALEKINATAAKDFVELYLGRTVQELEQLDAPGNQESDRL
jgi:hypothetical protein